MKYLKSQMLLLDHAVTFREYTFYRSSNSLNNDTMRFLLVTHLKISYPNLKLSLRSSNLDQYFDQNRIKSAEKWLKTISTGPKGRK